MFKGILKLVTGAVLTLVCPAAITIGAIVGFSANSQQYRDKKTDIIAEYKLTQEFQDERTEQQAKYLEALNHGYMTPQEYIEKLEEIESVSYAEKVMIENVNSEYLPKIKEVNSQIEKAGNQEGNGMLIAFIGGLLGAIPSCFGPMVFISGKKDIDDAKHQKNYNQTTKAKIKKKNKKFKQDDERIIDI